MSAFITATVNEDGVIEPEVIGTRMDPDEYAMRTAKIKVRQSAIDALTILATSMNRPECGTCPLASETDCPALLTCNHLA